MLIGGSQRSSLRRFDPVGAPLLTAAAWLMGVATSAAVAGTPYLAFGVHSRTAHLLLDTVDACIALLLTYLVWGRFTRTHRLQDLMLAQGLLLLAVAGVGPRVLAALFDTAHAGPAEVWSAQAMRVAAALLLAAAALVGRSGPPTRVRGPVPWLPLLVVLAGVAVIWTAAGALPTPLVQTSPASATGPVITGHPLLLTSQVVAGLAFAVASIAFTLQARRDHDALVVWLGPACALAGFARVNYFLFPSLYTDWVYTGDLLRTASYAVLLVGAAREIGEYWTDWARGAVHDDRQRLAREIHDGVVQELAYVRGSVLSAVPDSAQRDDILAACDRGLDEARAAVDALGRAPDEPLAFLVHRAARQVAERYGARVQVDLDDSVDADHEQRHALMRITREAVSNAIRHGAADSVAIRLERAGDRARLVVRDDGRGFDPDGPAGSSGYGLTSMRERAAALPGTFRVSSVDGQGTTVVVTWPAT